MVRVETDKLKEGYEFYATGLLLICNNYYSRDIFCYQKATWSRYVTEQYFIRKISVTNDSLNYF